MGINKLAAVANAVALIGNLGLAEIVDAQPKARKPPISRADIKPELRTLQQWGVPDIADARPYRTELDHTFRVNGKPTNVEYVNLGGNVYLRNVLNGKVYIIFICKANPSSAEFYFSGDGKLFENLSPEGVACNPDDYRPQ